MTKWRFDIVVVNYNRAESFTRNAWRLGTFSPRDRISFVSASPSAAEEAIIREWANDAKVTVRYFGRENRGLSELPRLQYYSGQLGGPENYTDSQYIFLMQDHYLDTDSPWSKWDSRFDFRIKGDVVPDMVFDLDAIDQRMQAESCVAAFADRNNPCWIEVDGKRHIAPSGGNFIVRTDQIARPEIQRAIRHLRKVCDNTYTWGLYNEFVWGLLLFHEGAPVLDLKRDRVFTRFDREDFYVAPDDFAHMHRIYGPTILGTVLRVYWRMRRAAARMLRSVLEKKPATI